MGNLLSIANPTLSKAAVAAGTDEQYGAQVDMQNYEGVVFVLHLGTVTDTSAITLDALGGNTSGSATAVMTGSASIASASTDSNTILTIDVHKPNYRYVRPRVTIATANAAIASMIAIPYGPRKAPVTLSAEDSNIATSPAATGDTDAGT